MACLGLTVVTPGISQSDATASSEDTDSTENAVSTEDAVTGEPPLEAGDATIERAREEVLRFQEGRFDELFERHTDKARGRLQTPERLLERTLRDRGSCVETALISERFDCYLEPQAESLDPFCVYDRRVQCEGLPDTSLYNVSLEPGSGAIQRIQRIDTKPPSTGLWLMSRGCAAVVVSGLMAGFATALVLGIVFGIRYFRRLQREYLDRAAKALGAVPPETFRRDTRIEGQAMGLQGSAGIEVRSFTYYYDDRPRTRFTFHPWIQLDHPRPLNLGLKITGRPPVGWLASLYYRIFPPPPEVELGDPRFDERFQLETTDLAATRELLATPVQGGSIARWLIAHDDREILLDDQGVRLACSLREADDAWLAEALDLARQLTDVVEGARRD